MSNAKKPFEVLSKIDVNSKTEQKGGLTYLSWAWAWQTLLDNYPTSTYKVYKNSEGLNYHHDNSSGWVEVGVLVEGIEHIEMLPIMDFRNKAIKVGQFTSCDVNKAIQRACTKAIARHGLGLYIYAGEDLPTLEFISKEEVKHLEKRLNETKSNISKFLEVYKLTKLEDMPKSWLRDVYSIINKKGKDNEPV